jgi:hypothetical protein
LGGSSHRTPVDRLILSLAEQRRDLGLSLRQLGELASYSGETVRLVEADRARNPVTVCHLRLALLVFELYGRPLVFDEDLDALLHIRRAPVAA